MVWNLPHCACPDDADLTCNIIGTKVKSIIFDDAQEIFISFEGGSGDLMDNGVLDKWDHLSSFDINIKFPEGDEEILQILKETADQLTRWKNADTELQLLGAPNRLAMVVENEDNWLPLIYTSLGN